MLMCLNGGGTSITTSTLRVVRWPVCSGAARLPNPAFSPRIPRSSAGMVRARLWCDGVPGAIVVTCGAATRPPAGGGHGDRHLPLRKRQRPFHLPLGDFIVHVHAGPPYGSSTVPSPAPEPDVAPVTPRLTVFLDEDARRATDRAHLGPRRGRDEELVERGRVGTW